MTTRPASGRCREAVGSCGHRRGSPSPPRVLRTSGTASMVVAPHRAASVVASLVAACSLVTALTLRSPPRCLPVSTATIRAGGHHGQDARRAGVAGTSRRRFERAGGPSPYARNARYLTSWTASTSNARPSPRMCLAPSVTGRWPPGLPPGSCRSTSRRCSGSRTRRPRRSSCLAICASAREALSTAFRASTGSTMSSGAREDRRRRRRIVDLASGRHLLPARGVEARAAGRDTVLWVTTNEPQLHFEGLQPPAPGAADQPALYPMAEIRRRLLDVYLDPRGAAMPEVDQPGATSPSREPHHDPVLHARAELALAGGGAARSPAQRGGGDPRACRPGAATR